MTTNPKKTKKKFGNLYLIDLPKGAKIKAECHNSAGKLIGDTITFDHIDGMYSYCTVDGMKAPGNVVHLAAMTPLKEEGDHYIINPSE